MIRAYHADALHEQDRPVFDAGLDVDRLLVDDDPPWVCEEHPERVQRDREEVACQRESGLLDASALRQSGSQAMP